MISQRLPQTLTSMMTTTTTTPMHDLPVNAAELERLKKRFLKLDAFVFPFPPFPRPSDIPQAIYTHLLIAS
jgi:hypothetical protein